MKKILIIAIACIFSVGAFAQSNVITKHFSDYQQDAAFTKVNVSSKMFSLFTEIDGEDEVELAVLDAMSKLKGVKAVISSGESDGVKPDGAKYYREALSRVQKDGTYEELMSIQDKEEEIMFMIRNEGDIIAELFMIIRGADDFVLMTLYGEIDLNQIAKISRILKIAGMEEFGILGGE